MRNIYPRGSGHEGVAQRFGTRCSKFFSNAQYGGPGGFPRLCRGLASQAGQKIYSITQDVYQNNPSIVSLALAEQSQTTRDRIQQALDAGQEVTVHEAPVQQGGWHGAGFILVDPATGAGAYLIDGGANGGALAGDFGQRYLAWVCDHMITDPVVLALLFSIAPFATVPKSLFGLSATSLGGSNEYTTVLRAIAVLAGWSTVSEFAKIVGRELGFGPAFLAMIMFVGIFNVTTLIMGIFYAANRDDDPGGATINRRGGSGLVGSTGSEAISAAPS